MNSSTTSLKRCSKPKLLKYTETAAITIFILIVLLHARMFIGQVWSASKYAGVYEIAGDDGRIMKLVIGSSSEVTIDYQDEDGLHHTASSTWRGEHATRILGPLYKPEGHFYRWVADGVEPILMRANYTKLSPQDSSIFPSPGRNTSMLIYFQEDAVKFEGMWLYKQK